MNRLHRDENGATGAVVLFVLLFALLPAGAVAVDLGNVWQVRRVAATATDAASLAEARQQSLADPRPPGEYNCGTDWSSLLHTNVPDRVVPADHAGGLEGNSSCVVHVTGPGTGYVLVEAALQADTFFARMFGRGAQLVPASSGAMYGFATAVDGLRPLAFCQNDPHIAAWIDGETADDDPLLHTEQGWHRVWIRSTAETACGGANNGNWGRLDFNGGGGGEQEFEDVLLNGFWEFSVAVGDCNDDNAIPGEPCPTEPGDPPAGAIRQLCEDETEFWAVVFSSTVGGSGNTTQYVVSGFVPLRIRGFQGLSGSPPNRHAWNGSTCGPTTERLTSPYGPGGGVGEGGDGTGGGAGPPADGDGGEGGGKGGGKDGGSTGTDGGGTGAGGGGNGDPGGDKFIEFEIRPAFLSGGSCCSASDSRLPPAIRRCTVDIDPQTAQDRCDPTS